MTTEATVDWEKLYLDLLAEQFGREENGGLTVREAGHLGGCKVRDKLGIGHYQRIGKLGGAAVAARYGGDFYREIGRKGGAAVAATRGEAYYAEIGTKGGNTLLARYGHDYFSRIGKLGGRRSHRPSRLYPEQEGWPTELRQLREQAGLRQGDVAAALGCSIALVSQVERGRRPDEALWRERYARAVAGHPR